MKEYTKLTHGGLFETSPEYSEFIWKSKPKISENVRYQKLRLKEQLMI